MEIEFFGLCFFIIILLCKFSKSWRCLDLIFCTHKGLWRVRPLVFFRLINVVAQVAAIESGCFFCLPNKRRIKCIIFCTVLLESPKVTCVSIKKSAMHFKIGACSVIRPNAMRFV
jgi:hypothetical protein